MPNYQNTTIRTKIFTDTIKLFMTFLKDTTSYEIWDHVLHAFP